mgnify:CR=1 FL=1
MSVMYLRGGTPLEGELAPSPVHSFSSISSTPPRSHSTLAFLN